MPRLRKYDYQKDYPVKIFVSIPVKILNDLEKKGYDEKHINSQIIQFLDELSKK
jgi:hypothetical protein